MRKVFVATSTLVVLGLVLQFYFAAIGVFSDEEDSFSIHGLNGRIVLPVLILLNIAAAAAARAGRRTVWLAVLDLGLLIGQTLLFIIVGAVTDSTPPPDGHITTAGTILLGFHAVNGLAILGVALVIARRASHLNAGTPPAAPAAGPASGSVPAEAASPGQ